MDLSMVGLDVLSSSSDPSFVSSDHDNNNNNNNNNKQKVYGSDWRSLKMAKTEDFSSVYSNNKQVLRSNNSDDQNMLSFSVNDSKNGGLNLYNNASGGYFANSGYGYGGGMNGVIQGVKGPFTPSQWMELEHQALIYKYILANIAVPSNLLLPIKKALDSAGFSVGPLRPTSYGWGGFHLGFSSNTDPEPGRCRRTDGKKWRCSRDAVPDQKYCERHINRGRHRSRKPVEGQTGSTTNVPAMSAKIAQAAASSPAVVVPGGGVRTSGLGMSLKNLQQPSGTNPNNSSLLMDGIFLNKNNLGQTNQATTDLSMFSSGINSKNMQFSIDKPQNPYTKPAQSEFGLVFSDSLLNPIQENPSDGLSGTKSSVHHQFMDEWPKNNLSDNNTNLSISIPISTSDFMSSTSSPTEEKLASSPLRLSSNWVPISWEGPLGEVLHNTNQTSSLNENKLSSGLNLMTDGWNSSSPNGPFQRMAFGSQSNSSAGSSPRGVSTSFAPLL